MDEGDVSGVLCLLSTMYAIYYNMYNDPDWSSYIYTYPERLPYSANCMWEGMVWNSQQSISFRIIVISTSIQIDINYSLK